MSDWRKINSGVLSFYQKFMIWMSAKESNSDLGKTSKWAFQWKM